MLIIDRWHVHLVVQVVSAGIGDASSAGHDQTKDPHYKQMAY
jgi:hypothetical protein